MLNSIKKLFVSSIKNSDKDNYFYQSTFKIWSRATRSQIERSLKEYGLYNDYKNYSNLAIAYKMSERAKRFNKIYKIY